MNKLSIITLTGMLLTACANKQLTNKVPENGIMVHEWEVGYDTAKYKGCYAKKELPILQYTYGSPVNTVLVKYTKADGITFNFGFNQNSKIPGSIKIDDNQPITYTNQIIKGKQAESLLNEMLNGKFAEVKTVTTKGYINRYSFNASGFKQAYDKMMQFYKII